MSASPQPCVVIVTTPARWQAVRRALDGLYIGYEAVLVGEFADDVERAIVLLDKPFIRVRTPQQ